MAGAPAVFLNPQAHSLRATCPPSAQCSLRHTWPLAVLEHEETVGELCLKHNSKENRKRRNGQNLRKNHWLCHWIDVARCCPECASSEEDRRNNIFDLLDKTSNILNNYIIHLQTCGGICFVILDFRNLYRASISVDFRNIQQPPRALQSMDAKILSILHYSFA